MKQPLYLLTRSAQAQNAYGPFTQEILASEGLVNVQRVDLDIEPLADLGQGDLAVLTRCALRLSEIDALLDSVRRGLRLVVLAPSNAFLQRVGWRPASKSVYPGWARVAQGYPGAGDPLQTHIPVAKSTPYEEQVPEWTPLAHAVDADWRDAGAPAAAQFPLGDGAVGLFLYDLPKAVARIRFGNPDLAGYVQAGLHRWQHAGDLFIGHVDLRVIGRPQADFHAQLLVRLLTDLAPWPLPRLWYYERGAHRAAAVFQSDGDNSKTDDFRALDQALTARGATATFYLMPTTKMTPDLVQEFRDRGHTFGPHVNVLGERQTEEMYFEFPEALREQTAAFRERFGTVSTSLQAHGAPWSGYMEWVPDHIAEGYRMLFVYLSLTRAFLGQYMCGSGRPLRFCGLDGTVHDAYQQPIVTYDDQSIQDYLTEHPGEMVATFESRLREALEHSHTAMGILSHPVSFAQYSRPAVERYLDALAAAQVPVYNGDAWCALQDRRRAVELRCEVPSERTVLCTVENLRGPLCLMVPVPSEAGEAVVRVDGAVVEPEMDSRLTAQYLLVDLAGKPDGASTEVEMRWK